jgi:prolyl-tRNA synthetase
MWPNQLAVLGGGARRHAMRSRLSSRSSWLPPNLVARSMASKASNVITPRAENYSKWYLDVIAAADLIENSPVKGCMVVRPTGMALWDHLKNHLDVEIKETGAENVYFPLFIPLSFFSKEAEHVDGFAKECAVVTHHRLRQIPGGAGLEPDPDAMLDEPLVVRPTSETLIWDKMQKWVESYRDLPMKLNQWANVVRWEMRTRPFLRSSEFLWQEGHTAHATKECALSTAEEMLHVYGDAAESVLAVPVIRGLKSPTERFAGADETYTIEAMMQNGWALQSGTSHFLGQNFAKAFDVTFQTAEGSRELVWATSWGVSTRLVGALIMTHSDDQGLSLPPAAAPIQIVVLPIVPGKASKEAAAAVQAHAQRMKKVLKKAGMRVRVDDREHVRPGAKFFEWERKGVPLRLEIGLREMESGAVVGTRRIDAHLGKAAKGSVQLQLPARADQHDGGGDADSDAKHSESEREFAESVQQELDQIQHEMLTAAENRLRDNTYSVATIEEMEAKIAADSAAGNDGGGFFLVPWAEDATGQREDEIQARCKATLRCYPIADQALLHASPESKKCFYTGEEATHMAIFARAF